ncbi:hypothetical protein Tco_1442424, partial [Tanacetum coccineum]
DFEERLGRIFDRRIHRVHVLDFDVLTEEMQQVMTDRLKMEHTGGDGQAPEKVTTTDLFYLRSMDEGTMVNVPYLVAYYLFKHASGRKQGAKMSGDSEELIRLRTCERLGDVLTWVALGPGRQTIPQRLHRLEEEIHKLGESIKEQCVVMERLSSDFVSFSTWMITRMTQLMDQSSLGYMRFDGSIACSSHMPYQRRTRQSTDDVGTSAPQQT